MKTSGFRIVFVVIIIYYIRFVCAHPRVPLSIHFCLNRFCQIAFYRVLHINKVYEYTSLLIHSQK